MDDADKGYRIDGTFYPWGTAFEEPAERPCSSAYGFETIFVELFASDSGRPVTTASYELANVADRKVLFAELVKRLGQPTEIDRSGEEEARTSHHNVVLNANWERGNHTIIVSFWGAPRPSDFGEGIGRVYVSWNDTEAAAAPFVDEWRSKCEAVGRAAAALEGKPEIFTVAWPIFDKEYPEADANQRALDTPELLETPIPVADELNNYAFALWRGGGVWHLSHGRGTVVLGAEPIHVMDVAPARGGGFSAIEVGPWGVRDRYRSRSIADAVASLERIPGLTLERHEGKDA